LLKLADVTFSRFCETATLIANVTSAPLFPATSIIQDGDALDVAAFLKFRHEREPPRTAVEGP
jgi:hypothetical protein